MSDTISRIVENLIARTEGPLHFRLMLQPVMAMVFAFIDGRKDAKAGRPPYFWSMLRTPEHRVEMMKDGWKSVGKVFILALVLDAIYQFIVQRFIYPGEAIITAFILAILPYLILRGLVTRVFRNR